MKVYKVLTPAVGTIERVTWKKHRFTGTVLGEGVSPQGVPLLRVRFAPKAKPGRAADSDMDIGEGEFNGRNPSNSPTVFFFQQKWWVRAKRSRRKWETALTLGSHVLCGTNKTLDAASLRHHNQFGDPSYVATWLPYEKRNVDGSRTTLLYEVEWRV